MYIHTGKDADGCSVVVTVRRAAADLQSHIKKAKNPPPSPLEPGLGARLSTYIDPPDPPLAVPVLAPPRYVHPTVSTSVLPPSLQAPPTPPGERYTCVVAKPAVRTDYFGTFLL